MIANASKNADGSLTDHKNLNYTGNLELKDLQDHNDNKSRGFNVSTNIGIPQGGSKAASTAPKGSTTIGLNSSGQETEQLTKATLGYFSNTASCVGVEQCSTYPSSDQGTVKNRAELTNRDINNTQEITRDQTTGMLNGSVTVDHRLMSESGRAEIVKEQEQLIENFRQSTENLAKALPDGEYKQNALQTLNNIQAKLANNPEMRVKGGDEVYEGYKEFIRQGGEPKEYETIFNQEVLPLAKDFNNLAKQAYDEISQEIGGKYNLDDQTSKDIIKAILLDQKNGNQAGCINGGTCTVIITKAEGGTGSQILLSGVSTDQLTVNNDKKVKVIDGSNLAISLFDKSATVSYKIAETIDKTGIDPQAAGLAMSLAFGGPVRLVKDMILNAAIGEQVEQVENTIKNQVTAIVRESDRNTISELTSKDAKQGKDVSTQEAIEAVQHTKDGVGFLAGIVGVTGGVIAGKIAKGEEPEIHNSKVDNNGTADTTYSGDVYSPDFKGPVEWDYYYRGDATKRDTFESSMTQTKGSNATNSYINSLDNGNMRDMYGEHGISSSLSPMVSTSKNPTVSEYFSKGTDNTNPQPTVTTFRIEKRESQKLQDEGRLVPNFENPMSFFEPNPRIGLPESEYLFRDKIDPKYIFEQKEVKK